MTIPLPDPQILHLAGDDALSFAQAQFSSDLSALDDGYWQWSAWLSAQGRVRAFFHLLREDAANLRLILRGGSAAILRDALARYVLRAKVRLQVIEGRHARLIEDADRETAAPPTATGLRFAATTQGTYLSLPGATPRWLHLGEAHAMPAALDDADARNRAALADIDAGLVTLDDALQDKLLPDWIGLRELGAVHVGKGCYPGQEIVARLHFRGGNKRWLHRLEFTAGALPPPGTPIDTASETPGAIVCAAWATPGHGAALAVLPETPIPGTSIPTMPHLKIGRIERCRKQDV